MHSHICIVAPHLGTLAKTHEGCGVGAKPEDGVWWIHPEDGRILKFLHGVEMFRKTVQANLTDLSRILGKPQSIISLLPSKQLILYMLSVLLH
jgi:hypothetical protein